MENSTETLTNSRKQVHWAADPASIKSFFQDRLPGFEGKERIIEQVKVNVLRSRFLGKSVFEYDIKFRQGKRHHQSQLIGKIRYDNQKQKAAEVLRKMWLNGFGRHTHFFVPKPLAYFSGERFLVEEKIEGELLRHVLAEDKNIKETLDGAASWLTKLHTCGIHFPQKDSIHKTLGKLEFYGDLLGKVYRRKGLGRLTERLKDRARLVSQSLESVPVHGDYHPRNIIMEKNGLGVAVIDFEECCQSDPARDVGYFLGQLKMTFPATRVSEEGTANFFTRYLSLMPGLKKTDFLAKVSFYEAVTYLQRLAYCYQVFQIQDPKTADQWLKKSEQCLERNYLENFLG